MSQQDLQEEEINKEFAETKNLLDNLDQFFEHHEGGVINEKEERCRDFKNGKYGEVPRCYKENSPKEELVLEHVIQYSKQFKFAYDENRELFLFPKNECDVYKFICTTVRPTKMGYLELYDYEKAAEFIGKFILYEELDPPNEYPRVIPSPTNVMNWQKGDCFDISILLCSILIGAGYDAYVVFGTADRIVTTKNETYMEYEGLAEEGLKGMLLEDEVEVKKEVKKSEFGLDKKPPIISKYDTEKEKARIKEEEEEKLKAVTIDDEVPEKLGEDEFEGQRKHCWVLVKSGKRDVKTDTFIEPGTGRRYGLQCDYYLTVDCVFNNQNYWVNMERDKPCKDVNFNNMDDLNGAWEYVMLDTVKFEEDFVDADDDDDGITGSPMKIGDDDNQLKDIAQTLDMQAYQEFERCL